MQFVYSCITIKISYFLNLKYYEIKAFLKVIRSTRI